MVFSSNDSITGRLHGICVGVAFSGLMNFIDGFIMLLGVGVVASDDATEVGVAP